MSLICQPTIAQCSKSTSTALVEQKTTVCMYTSATEIDFSLFGKLCIIFNLCAVENEPHSIEAFLFFALFLPGYIVHTAGLATRENLCKAKSWKTKFAACGFNKYSMKMGNPIHSRENM